MLWLIVVTIAYLFYAAVFVIDKYILSRPMPHPIVFAFYVCVLSLLVIVLIPFGFVMPNGSEIFWSLLAGLVQVIATIMLYKVLNKGEVSRVVPFIGAVSAVFIFILNSIMVKEFLSSRQIIAFFLLIIGSFIIGFKKEEFLGKKIVGLAIASAFLFALFWIITKYLFLGTNFISGLIWVRVGAALWGLALLLPKKNRELIFSKTKETKPKIFGFFMVSRVMNAIGGMLLYWAVFLGSVVLINALQGLQYLFILLLAFLLFKKIPILKEQFGREVLIQKIAAIVLICLGLAFLVI